MDTDDAECSRRAVNQENIKKLHKIVFTDYKLKVSGIAVTKKILIECVHKIVHKNLSMAMGTAFDHSRRKTRSDIQEVCSM